jgi:outer membrane protein, heavy metal efflux system
MRAWIPGLLIASCFMGACATYRPRPLQAPDLERAYRERALDDGHLREFIEASIGAPMPSWPPESLDLKTLTLIAYYYSPELDVARAQLATAEAGVRAARGRVNPGLTASGGYNRDPASHLEAGLSPSFTLETAGKRGYRILRAQHELESAQAGLAEATWQLRSRVRTEFFNHLLADARLALLERERRTRADIVDMFSRRVEVGEAARPELDVFRLDLILTEATFRTARGDAVQTRAALENVIGLPPGALLDARWTAPTFDAPPPADALPIKAVQRAGMLHRADVRRSLSDFAVADSSLRLELARQYPDLVLSPTFSFEEDFARYILAATLEPLAVLHRNQGPIALAEARREEAAVRFEALQATAIGQFERALITYGAAFDTWQQASTQLTTVQRDREDAARQALAAGEGDRLTLATAQLQTVTAARTRLDALSEVQGALGALEDAMQQPLEDALNLPDPLRASPRKGAQAQ